LNAIKEGRVTYAVMDKTIVYEETGEGAKLTGLDFATIGFRHTVGATTAKKDFGNAKKDMVIFKFFGLDQVQFGAKKVATCLTKAKVHFVEEPDQVGDFDYRRCVADTLQTRKRGN